MRELAHLDGGGRSSWNPWMEGSEYIVQNLIWRSWRWEQRGSEAKKSLSEFQGKVEKILWVSEKRGKRG